MKYIYVLLLLSALNLQAQWLTHVSAHATYDDNIFATYKNQNDTYFAPRLHLSNIQEASEVYYTADFLQLANNSHFNNSNHTLGIEFFPELDARTYTMDLGASLNFRFNQDDYIYRNFTHINGYMGLKTYFAPNMLSQLQLSLDYKSFPDEYEWNIPWDHKEASLYLQHNIFLQTGTTLRAGLQGLVRDFNYYNTFIDGYFISGELPTIFQGVFTMRAAQSITPTMGGYTEFSYRYNPSESNPCEPEIMSFSPIDDYFGYGEQAWKVNLKYKILPSLSINTDVRVYEKDYKNRPIYEYNFVTESFNLDEEDYYIPTGLSRKDSGYLFNLGLNYHLSKVFQKATSLSLRMNYTLQSNQSNDAYFTYVKQSASLQLGYNFQK